MRLRLLCGMLFLTVPNLAGVYGQERPDPTKEDNAVLTETLGLIASLQLYQTYLNIGLLADAKAEGLYSVEDVAQLLGSAAGPLDKVDKQLEKVAKLKLTKEDSDAIARLRKIAGLLREQSKELAALWGSGKEENGKKYETARQSAWKELAALLELETTDTTPPPPREVPPPKK